MNYAEEFEKEDGVSPYGLPYEWSHDSTVASAIYARWLENKLSETAQACHDCYEIYANMEGHIPETAPEVYLLRIIEEMKDAIKDHKWK